MLNFDKKEFTDAFPDLKEFIDTPPEPVINENETETTNNMILYHGGNVEVKEPRILAPGHALDFGPGFYTTLNRDQAVDFAGKVVLP